MIHRTVSNGFRLDSLERAVLSGSTPFADSPEEEDHIAGLLKLKSLGLLGQSLPQAAASILATLPDRLASYVRDKYPPEAVVAWTIENVEDAADIAPAHIEEAAEQSAAKRESTVPSRLRSRSGHGEKGYAVAGSGLTARGSIGKKRRHYLVELHTALRDHGGDREAARQALGWSRGSMRTRMRWVVPDDLVLPAPPKKEKRGRPKKAAQHPTRAIEVQPAKLAALRDLIAAALRRTA